ncbi:MAG: xylosidase, partial [Mucilaginibacter sp.]
MAKIFLKVIPFLTLVVPAISIAQNYQKTVSGAKASINGVLVEVQFYSPEIVRVTKAPEGRPFTKESLSVIKKPQQTRITLKQHGDILNLRSEKLNVGLNLKSGELTYITVAGKVLLKEKANGAAFTPFSDAGNQTYSISQAFMLDNDEPIYGLGQH